MPTISSEKLSQIHRRKSKKSKNKHAKNNEIIKKNFQISTKSFIKKMQLLGYSPDTEGVCHGIACVAMHAMLLKQVSQFDDDILKIHQIRRRYNRGRLIEHAFCQSVQLCQDPDDYPHLFNSHKKIRCVKPVQNPNTSLPLIMSSDLETQGGITCIGKFSGTYKIRDIEIYCRCIRTAIEQFPHPFSLLLSDEGHLISITYCTDRKLWLMVEPRSLPTREYETDLSIARAIANAMTTDLRMTVFSTMVYASKMNEKISTQVFNLYSNQPEWKKIHSVSEKNKPYFSRWLYITACDGCFDDAKKLLDQNTDPNKPIIKNANPLSIAAQQGNFHLVNLLLTYGATPNLSKKLDASPLYLAISHGHHQISDLLRQHGAHLQKDETEKLQAQGLILRQ